MAKVNHEEVIKRIAIIHGSDLSLLTKYTRMKDKHSFICNKCNHNWEAQVKNVINNNSGCPNCSRIDKINRIKQYNILKVFESEFNFRKMVKDRFGGMYEIRGEYIDSKTKIKLYCFKHGEFEIRPYAVVNKNQGCPDCGIEKMTKSLRVPEDTFKKKLKELGNGEYLLYSEYVSMSTKVSLLHKECQKVYEVLPIEFTSHDSRCPYCKSSKGEKEISKTLSELSLRFINQYKLDGCVNKTYLPFDFAIINKNVATVLVEFDGRQHFEIVPHWGGWVSFDGQINNDKIKNRYCIDNDIPLIRIPYKQQKNIEYILHNVLIYFGLIENKQDTYDKDIVIKYLVDENWNHEKYIEENR